MSPWWCPWCGGENFQDDRIAFREPACIFCGNERMDPQKLKEELELKKTLIQREIDTAEGAIKQYREQLWALENQMSEIREEMCPIKKEIASAEEYTVSQEQELARLNAIRVYEKPCKRIAPTQARLGVDV